MSYVVSQKRLAITTGSLHAQLVGVELDCGGVEKINGSTDQRRFDTFRAEFSQSTDNPYLDSVVGLSTSLVIKAAYYI